jgi:hypothetical protein
MSEETEHRVRVVHYQQRPHCRHCGVRLRAQVAETRRYRWVAAGTPDTAIFGSGSECPKNATGHEAEETSEPGGKAITDGLGGGTREAEQPPTRG